MSGQEIYKERLADGGKYVRVVRASWYPALQDDE